MEVIFMDKAYMTTRVIDAFSSLIWNERYIGYGDFELRFPMDNTALAGIREGWYASIKESDRYMIVEGIEITTSVEEGSYAIVTGRSLESILERRVIMSSPILLGNLQKAILRLLNANAISPSNTKRKIPELGMKLSTDTSITSITVDMEYSEGDNLYDVIYDLCSTYHVGFRILPQDNGSMLFELYNGVDRSYGQETNPWVVFSPQFENIQETDMTMDTSGMKNVAIAVSTYTDKWTDDIGVEHEEEKTIKVEVGDSTGLDRREIYMTSSIKPDDVVRSAFGEATDRVNMRDYMTYEEVYFDSSSYGQAQTDYYDRVADRAPTKPPPQKKEWVEIRPGDAGFEWSAAISGGDPLGINGYWQLVDTPQADFDKWEKDYDNYWAAAENGAPNRNDYVRYDWVLTDSAGYNQAISEANSAINAEYAAARAEALNVAKSVIKNATAISLSSYLVISEFDGEVDSKVQAQFGKDYYLGDVVQIVNEFNFQAVTRVVGMTYSEEEGVGFVARPSFESDDKTVFEI